MFGRIVNVYADTDKGERIVLVDSSQGNKALICEGDIERYPTNSGPQQMILSIYNLSSSIRNTIKTENYNTIIVEFGYKDVGGGEVGTLFKGQWRRVVGQRLDSTTSVTKFYVYSLGDAFLYGYFSGYFIEGTTLYDVAKSVAESGEIKIPIILSEKLKGYPLQESLSLYDTQINILNSIAKLTGMLITATDEMIAIRTKEESANEEYIMFTGVNERNKIVSQSGLIGIPTMEDDGLNFECLINTELKLHSLVQINNAIISEEQEGFESRAEIGAEFDQNGLYRVMKINVHFTNGAGESKMVVKAKAAKDFKGVV